MQPLLEDASGNPPPFTSSVPLEHSSNIDILHSNPRSRWPEWIALSLYAVLVAFAIPYHEPWADEAQSWQLARTLSLPELFHTYLRYEGSPGLWHFLLWIMVRIHLNYAGLHWVCGAIAAVAASVLIFRSPFPRYLRLTLPFTYFLLFQYAIIARSYALVPLLLFIIAWWWKRSPVLIALLLGLVANVALHAAVLSGGLAIAYCIAQARDGAFRKPGFRRKLLWSALILLGFYAFAVWTAWPPHDLLNQVSQARRHPRPFLQWALISLTWGMCEPWVLSILFWIAIALCLNARRSLYYLLPVLLFSIFCGAVDVGFWHAGLLVPLVICTLWITWPASNGRTAYEMIGRAAMVLLVGVQILWSAYAIAYDHSHAYSPDLAAARFLQPLVRNGATIAVTSVNMPEVQAYDDVGILPYFDHNVYVNQPHPFWWWSTQNHTQEMFPAALRSHPPVVLIETRRTTASEPFDMNHPSVKLAVAAGYRLTNVFCGAKPLRLELSIEVCHLIFRPVETAPVIPANVHTADSPTTLASGQVK